jgi:hypothetical protein
LGKQRVEKAANWIKGLVRGAGEKVAGGWNFMKKLGAKIGEGAREAVYGAATIDMPLGDAKDAVVDGYKHVSEGVKAKGAEVWGRVQEGYGKVMEIKDNAIERGRQKIGQIVESGRNFCDSKAEQFKSWQAQQEAARMKQERESRLAATEAELKGVEDDNAYALQMIEENNSRIERLKALREQLLTEDGGQTAQTEQGA